MGVYLRAKFEVSCIILTGFRQGWGGGGVILPPSSKETPKKPTQIRINELKFKKKCTSDAYHCKT